MNSKHTPGPWGRNIKARGKYPIIFAGHNTHVAQACQMPDADETEANITLIAKAPELLECLAEAERALKWAAQESRGKVRKEIVGGWTHHADKYRALIAEIEGGEG